MPPEPAALLDYDEALKKISALKTARASEQVPLADALGRFLAAPITAPYALPPFDNTGVDGYAFRHAGNTAQRFSLRGQSLASEPFQGKLSNGDAIHIATGAMLPEGADTVAMQEHCRLEGDFVLIDNMPEKNANIRLSGNDVKKGEVVFNAAHRLRAQDTALLCALGFTGVNAAKKMRVAIMSTGHELKAPGAALRPGEIIDSNGLMLRHMLAAWPVTVDLLTALPDERLETEAALLRAAQEYDVVITTGGISVGKRDFVRDVLLEKSIVHFWKLAIRPGRPAMLGQIGHCFMVCLPGNPVSAFVTFQLVVRPLLMALNNDDACLPRGFMLPLAVTARKPEALRDFQRARLVENNGALQVQPYRDQSSNLLSSLSGSDGLIDLPPGRAVIEAGTHVLYRPFAGLLG